MIQPQMSARMLKSLVLQSRKAVKVLCQIGEDEEKKGEEGHKVVVEERGGMGWCVGVD